jgi:hypothetical protein
MSATSSRHAYWRSTSLLAVGMVYAGFSFDFGGAILSHTRVGDTLLQTLPALVCAALLALSYVSYRARIKPVAEASHP